jgi:hypothetical protein
MSIMALRQRADDELRTVVLHAVEFGTVPLDASESMPVDTMPMMLASSCSIPPRRERRRHQQAADAPVLLRRPSADRTASMILLNCSQPGPRAALSRSPEGLGVGEHLMHVGARPTTT